MKPRKPNARTFGQDIMRGEHTVRATAVPGGGSKTGTSLKDVYKLKTDDGYKTAAEIAKGTAGLAYGINDWVAGKQNEGEIGGGLSGNASGTSIFDPVLCELVYRWFCPPGGQILDPFSGGSVRGIVASKLGYRYTGVDLSARQIEANKLQGIEICEPSNLPVWLNGNSLDIETLAAGTQADLVFSCPPYADLEVYSNDVWDLSNMSYAEFRKVYSAIIAACARMLKPNRFACFVVGDARGDDGCYYGFPWHTVQAFEDAGLRLYNEAILVTAVGSLPVRITKQFDSGRKLGKTHQNIFVFCKGDWKKAAKACIND